MSREAAQQAKNRGNKAFAEHKYDEALEAFAEAIRLDPTDPVFFSNRSGVYASMNKYAEALEDANKAIELKPNWGKAYSRKGLALFKMGQLQEAADAYEQGLEHEPENEQLRKGFEEVEAHLMGGAPGGPGGPGGGGGFPGMGQLFGPDMWAKIATNPRLKQFLNQPDFVATLQSIQRNPNSIAQHLQDPRILELFGALTGLNFPMPPGDAPSDGMPSQGPSEQPAQRHTPSPAPEPMRQEPPEEKMHSPEEAEARRKLAEANREKELGNEAYKNKRFEEALRHYTRAAELDPTNMVYLTNRAAVYFEMDNMDQCISDCKEAIEIGRANRADYKLMARAYARLGNTYTKMNMLDEALAAFEKSLVEFADDKVKRRVKELKEHKKKLESEAYLDEAKALEAKERGNEEFKKGNFAQAIQEFSEAIRRNPRDHRVYSNRAACYVKLMDWRRGLDDCDTCLKLEPTFIKAYIRKGQIQHLCKEFHKALDTFNAGLKLEPENQELIAARAKTMAAISAGMTGEVDQERAQRALADPDIQAILRDPRMQQILQDMQSDPTAASKYMRDADIRRNIEKLMAAGVIHMG